jgi:hypothetical protein
MNLQTYLKTIGRPLAWREILPEGPSVDMGLVDQVEVYEMDGVLRLGLVSASKHDPAWPLDRDYATSVTLKKDPYWRAVDSGIQFRMNSGSVYEFTTPVEGIEDMERVREWQNYTKTLAGVFQVDDAKKVWPKQRKTIATSI